MTHKQKQSYKAISFLFFSVVLLAEGVFSFNQIFLQKGSVATIDKQEAAHAVTQKANPFDSLSILAESANVYDTVTGEVLYAKNQKEVRPIASITKVVSALVSDEVLGAQEPVEIGSEALAQADDHGLFLNEIWPFKKLLDFSLLVSSNDGAYAIANIAGSIEGKRLDTYDGTSTTSVNTFVGLMNKKVQSIGLSNTRFYNPSGLDLDEVISGGYSSAEEIALLYNHIIKHNSDLLEATRNEEDEFLSDNGFVHSAKNTNESYSNIPGLLVSKTGYTDLAGGNLAIAYDIGINHPVVVVVLGSGYKDRFDDMADLVQATNEFFAR